MRTLVRKWGNRGALRIPKVLADEMGLEEYSDVDISVRSNKWKGRLGVYVPVD